MGILSGKKSPYYWDLKEVPVKSQYELFKKWSLLGSTFLKKKEWIEILNYCGYTGDYYFTNAKTLNLSYDIKS